MLAGTWVYQCVSIKVPHIKWSLHFDLSFKPDPTFLWFPSTIPSKHQHVAERWARLMGQTQFLSRWRWMIVNKVKLITDGCQLWSHVLPGAGGSHFESSPKLRRRRLLHMWISHRRAPVIVITRRVGSFVFNVSINRQSPTILFLYPRDTYLWSLVLLCEHLQLIMCALLTPNLESRCAAI